MASVLASSESNIATTLNTSARPREIVVSVGRVPNASVVPEITFTCFIKFVVLDFWITDVLRSVAVSFTFAELPRIVLSVTVRDVDPVPDNLLSRLTTSP